MGFITLDQFFSLESDQEILREFHAMRARRLIANELADRANNLRQASGAAYSKSKAAGMRFRARADELHRQADYLLRGEVYKDETDSTSEA